MDLEEEFTLKPSLIQDPELLAPSRLTGTPPPAYQYPPPELLALPTGMKDKQNNMQSKNLLFLKSRPPNYHYPLPNY